MVGNHHKAAHPGVNVALDDMESCLGKHYLLLWCSFGLHVVQNCPVATPDMKVVDHLVAVRNNDARTTPDNLHVRHEFAVPLVELNRRAATRNRLAARDRVEAH